MARDPEIRAMIAQARADKASEQATRPVPDNLVQGLGSYGRTSGVSRMIADTGKALLGYAYRCIELRAQMYASASAKYYVKSGQSERAELPVDHWLVTLNDSRPNFQYTRMQNKLLTQQSLDLFGCAYIYAPTFGTGSPKQLWVLDPRRIQVVQDPDTFVREFFFVTDNRGWLRIDPSEMIHKKEVNIFNRQYQLKGYPRIAAVIDSLSINSELKEFVNRYFKTDAIPPVLFKSNPGAKKLGPEGMAAIKADWNDVLPNVAVAGFMPEGLEVVPIVKMSKEIADRLISDATGVNVIREICTTFGVPLAMIEGEKDAYAGAVQVTNNFLMQTIQPLCMLHADAEMQFYGQYEQGIEIEYEVPLQTDRTFELQKKQVLGFKVNEVRKEQGLDPIEGGDEYLLPASFLPYSQILAGAQMGAPAATEPVSAPPAQTTPSETPSPATSPAPAASIGRSAAPKAVPFVKDEAGEVDPWSDEAFLADYQAKAVKRMTTHAEAIRASVVESFGKLEQAVLRNFSTKNGKRFTSKGALRKRYIGKDLESEELFNVDEFTDEFFNNAEPALKALIRDAMTAALADVGENWDSLMTEFDKRLNEVIAESASKITEPVKTVQDEMSKLLQKMKDNNETEIRDAIKSKFEQYSEGRANAIARTTSTAASGASQRSAWEAVNIKPAWLSQRNADVRVSHRRADGQKTDDNGYFHVGADRMKSPGTGGIAKENCNCHCSLRPAPKSQKHIKAVQIIYHDFITRRVYEELMSAA